MAVRARHEERCFTYSDMLLRLYQRQLIAQLRGRIIRNIGVMRCLPQGLLWRVGQCPFHKTGDGDS
jgi:hypothetical protein